MEAEGEGEGLDGEGEGEPGEVEGAGEGGEGEPPEVTRSMLFVSSEIISLMCVGGRGDDRTPTSRLFVKLSYDTERETLQDLFPNATDVFLPRDRETGEKRGWVWSHVWQPSYSPAISSPSSLPPPPPSSLPPPPPSLPPSL